MRSIVIGGLVLWMSVASSVSQAWDPGKLDEDKEKAQEAVEALLEKDVYATVFRRSSCLRCNSLCR